MKSGVMSRRGILQGAGALGITLAAQRLLPAYARTGEINSMKTPSGVGALQNAGDTDVINLFIEETPFVVNGRTGAAMSINGTIPGPLVRLREGRNAVINVTNRLKETTSIHWHGLIVPHDMDGVPGVSFAGIKAGTTFTYRFPVRQSGTYWCHSHSGGQEMLGVYAPLIIDPVEPEPFRYDRDYIVMLSDWNFDSPEHVLDHLKNQSNFYNFQQRTVPDFFRDVAKHGFKATVRERAGWARMRMDPTDIADVTGIANHFLINGLTAEGNWTGLFRPGERVRLRFINAGAMSFFDIRIPGLKMTLVGADGQYVQPVEVDEFRIAPAETYDMIVQPNEDQAYTIFAEAMDRSGYTRGTLSTRPGMSAPIPERRKSLVRSMDDMGMQMSEMTGMEMPGMPAKRGMNMPGMNHGNTNGNTPNTGDHSNMPGMSGGNTQSGNMQGMDMGGDKKSGEMKGMGGMGAMSGMMTTVNGSKNGTGATWASVPGSPSLDHGPDMHGPGNSAIPMMISSRLDEPSVGLGEDGRRVLVYTDLKAIKPYPDRREPSRQVELHITGNMERFMWSFDGKKYSEASEPIKLQYGERWRLSLVNDTMMEHPIHLHGMWMDLENGHGDLIPRKHTIVVKPAERVTLAITADAPGPWAMHCHLLLHMELGMFRVFEVVGGMEHMNNPGAMTLEPAGDANRPAGDAPNTNMPGMDMKNDKNKGDAMNMDDMKMGDKPKGNTPPAADGRKP